MIGDEFQIGSADPIAQLQQHFGESGHTDATDADEVDRLRFKKHFKKTF